MRDRETLRVTEKECDIAEVRVGEKEVFIEVEDLLNAAYEKSSFSV